MAKHAGPEKKELEFAAYVVSLWTLDALLNFSDHGINFTSSQIERFESEWLELIREPFHARA